MEILGPLYEENHAIVEVRLAYANALSGAGEVSQAEKIFRSLLESKELAPTAKAGLHFKLGVGLNRQGKFVEAVTELEKAVALNPEAPNPHLQLGGALLQVQVLDRAERELLRAYQLSGNSSPGAQLLLGHVYYAQKRFPDAQRAFEQYLKVLAGPDAKDSSRWATPHDGPDFLRDLVEDIKLKYPINARRVYLFGHSAGAGFALQISLLQSEYFAATAVHAGALPPESYALTEYAKRKIPMAIWVGDNDAFFPLDFVRKTRDALGSKGFQLKLTEMPNHDHWYYDLAPQINREAWEFLKAHELSTDSRYQQYQFQQ